MLLFGHTRPLYLADVLESLQRQDAIGYVDVWLDGHQGVPELKHKTGLVNEVANKYDVRNIYRHNGALGFRKLILHALSNAVANYKYIIVLEDDCFPTRHAIEIFMSTLGDIENREDVFSVYGHPFLVPAERDVCTRFQGWGWATTSEKLKPFLDKLIFCYSLTENEYLSYVEQVLTRDVVDRLDVTPPRLPTDTLRKFFAWDETLALLTAQEEMVHMKTSVRTIYNFGASEGSSRFKEVSWYRSPPYNMVSHEEVWDYF